MTELLHDKLARDKLTHDKLTHTFLIGKFSLKFEDETNISITQATKA